MSLNIAIVAVAICSLAIGMYIGWNLCSCHTVDSTDRDVKKAKSMTKSESKIHAHL